ncbi:MAG: hypothetical protein ACXVH2_06105 [Methanobacterium sp.]
MGELSEALDEFRRISKEHYAKIQQILKDEYCWKCPMRSTSTSTSCRDIDTWIRLTTAFESGIRDYLISKDESKDNIEAVTSRYLLKVIKKHSRHLKYHKTVVLKLQQDMDPYAKKDDLLIIKENVESVKSGDMVLWPQICPISIFWFSKLKIAGYVPFDIVEVTGTFHKNGCRYIQSKKDLEIPLEYTAGKIIRIIEKSDPLCSKLF